MILLTRLLLAHLTGDFLLQPDSWVKEKELKKHRSPKLYLHVLLHGLLSLLLVWDLSFVLPALIIAVTHFFIDLAKANLRNPDRKTFWLIADQALHLLVLVIVWYAWGQPVFSFASLPVNRMLVIITAAIFLTSPASTLIKMIISHWTPDTFYDVSTSLPDAGKIIGYLERLLVLTFILNNHWEAVGFLLAAKSVFRFGNLKESHDRKLTEYVLIGTLLSFTLALAVALLVSVMMKIPALWL